MGRAPRVPVILTIQGSTSLFITGLGMGLATGAADGGRDRHRSRGAIRNRRRADQRRPDGWRGDRVAVLGTVFALAGGGPQGLRWAMPLGGVVQLAATAETWTTAQGVAARTN
jgi:hypothetical protein